MLTDREYTNMTSEEIKDLFSSGQLHPDSEEGVKAINELASRDRSESKPIKKIAYWVLVGVLVGITLGTIGFILSFG